MSHTFRYNMHKVVLFSLNFSEQVHRNLWAAMPVSYSQHHGANTALSSTHCSCKPDSKSWTVQVNFCLYSPRLENMQVTFSYSYTLNIRGTQKITQQRAAPMYLLPAQQGLEWGARKHTCSTYPQDWLSHHSTRSRGTARFTISGKFLDCMWMFIHEDQCVKISPRNSLFSPHSHRLEARSQ